MKERFVDILEFGDYRAFLNAVLLQKKEKTPRFSVSLWSQKLELGSPTTLNMILRGQRHPGPDVVDSLTTYLGMDSRRRRYFEELVRLAKAKDDPRKTSKVLEKLREIVPDRDFRILEGDEFASISNWYFFAIREFVKVKEFREDHGWIAKRLNNKITPKQVAFAISTMLSINLLKRNPKTKRLEVAEYRFSTSTDVASEALKNFHFQMMTRAQEALREVPVSLREIRGSTVSIPLDKVKEAKLLIQKFAKEFCEIVESSKAGEADETYQLNVQFFPLTNLEAFEGDSNEK